METLLIATLSAHATANTHECTVKVYEDVSEDMSSTFHLIFQEWQEDKDTREECPSLELALARAAEIIDSVLSGAAD